MKSAIVLLLVVLSVGFALAGPHGQARGFGDLIDWYNDLPAGLASAKEKNLPVMMLIHKSWCGACKRLKPEFQASEDIRAIARSFVMVNLEDDEEPKDPRYSSDGGYIPRIFFLKADGSEIPNTAFGSEKYPHFYSSYDRVHYAMDQALGRFMLESTKQQK